MEGQVLREARLYEEKKEKHITEDMRPAFHLTPRTGWMNDPNGFSVYGGKYHMFYQYHPYDSHWGPMHWGHAVSDDMLNWEYLPAALAPDQKSDHAGCFSGSAIELPDGRQLLMYTGCSRVTDENDDIKMIQEQCIAVGDGENYVKYHSNPVLDAKDIPEGGSIYDFRDPKIITLSDGTYLCLIGNRPADGSGQILLYKSEDAFHWTYWKKLIENKNRYGKMWECPDFFELDGKWVLLTSPQDMLPMDLEFHNGNGTIVVIGEFDETTGEFKEESISAIDYGIDFYAPQTILDKDGNRVMIGWMQNWDSVAARDEGEPWMGQMSLPRTLSLKDGRLIQKPINAFDERRKNKITYENVRLKDDLTLDGIEGRCIDMEITVRSTGDLYEKFALWFAEKDAMHTSLRYRPADHTLKVDRKFSGSRRAILHQRRCRVDSAGDELKLRIILDRFSAEIFVNDGEKVMSLTLYTDIEATGISFHSVGEVEFDITKYDII
ncbi:MAG: glycoside hydrolase family 32 protein [Lachnospiraceae bacterium]|nr:glycoside hydrolase family 32 protein [Lachnospiraceae bacterium]